MQSHFNTRQFCSNHPNESGFGCMRVYDFRFFLLEVAVHLPKRFQILYWGNFPRHFYGFGSYPQLLPHSFQILFIRRYCCHLIELVHKRQLFAKEFFYRHRHSCNTEKLCHLRFFCKDSFLSGVLSYWILVLEGWLAPFEA